MKTIFNGTSLIVLFVLLIGCTQTQTQQQSAEEMLAAQQKQEEIFGAILSNSDLKMKFMDQMMEEYTNIEMMMVNIMNRGAQDTIMCHKMGMMLMEDEHMRIMMMDMMKDMMQEKDMKMGEDVKQKHMQMHSQHKNE